MLNSELNQATTTIEMYRAIQDLRILATFCKDGKLGEDAKSYVDRHISTEAINAVQDFYTSLNWRLIDEETK